MILKPIPARIILALFVVVALTMGCAATQPQTPRATYFKAVAGFNDVLETYLDIYDQQTPERQLVWDAKIDKWFERGSVALDLWQRALGIGADPQEAIDRYEGIKAFVLDLIEDLCVEKEGV